MKQMKRHDESLSRLDHCPRSSGSLAYGTAT
jgi:hypothetical protein